MVWHSHLLKNFPQIVVVYTVNVFGIVNKAEVDVFLELSCFFDDPVDVGNLISGSYVFSASSLNLWRFTVHILLKPGMENFEYYFTSVDLSAFKLWAAITIIPVLLFLNWNSAPTISSLLTPPTPAPYAHALHPISMRVTLQESHINWNHTVFVLLRSPDFILHNVLKVQSCFRKAKLIWPP